MVTSQTPPRGAGGRFVKAGTAAAQPAPEPARPAARRVVRFSRFDPLTGREYSALGVVVASQAGVLTVAPVVDHTVQVSPENVTDPDGE